MAETVELARRAMRDRKRLGIWHSCRQLLHMSLSIRLVAADVANSVGIDGMGIWGAGRVRRPAGHKSRISGVDLLEELWTFRRRKGLGLVFSAQSPPLLNRLRGAFARGHPGIEFTKLRDGYFTRMRSRKWFEQSGSASRMSTALAHLRNRDPSARSRCSPKMIPLAERCHLDVTRGIWQDMPVRTGTSLETISAENTASKSEDSECLAASLASGSLDSPNLVRNFVAHSATNVVAVCDFSSARLAACQSLYPAVTTTEQFEDLLKNPAINTEPTEKIKVYNKGITLNGSSEDASQLRIGYRGGDMWEPHTPASEAVQTEVSHFVDCLRKGAPILDDLSGLRIVNVLETASGSIAKQGRPVTLGRQPPVSKSAKVTA